MAEKVSSSLRRGEAAVIPNKIEMSRPGPQSCPLFGIEDIDVASEAGQGSLVIYVCKAKMFRIEKSVSFGLCLRTQDLCREINLVRNRLR
jgi:hypothetical protein